MPTSVLVTASFWRVLLERLGRQAAQTAVPILAAIVAAGGAVNLRTVGLGLAGSLAVTLVKTGLQYLTDVHATSDSPVPWQLLDRAVPAFFGVLAGLWPVNAEDLMTFDWAEALTAAGSAALVAVVALYATPPALTPAPRTPDGTSDVSSLPAQLQHADDLDAAGSDSGRAWPVLIVAAAALLLVGASAAPALAHGDHRQPLVSCPAPYKLTELHVYGQRIEHGLDGHGPSQVIQQNDPDAVPADHRYAVALACVRPLTDAERNADYFGRSTPQVAYPLMLAG